MFDKPRKGKKWIVSSSTSLNSEEEKGKRNDDPLVGIWTSSVLTFGEPNQDTDSMDNNMLIDPFFEYQFRVILIGDSGVGKSSLLRCFTDGTFFEVSDPTVGVDFFARVLKVADGTPIKLQLWDTAGHERFRSITKSYYRNSVGCLLVFDVCNLESFKNIHTWMNDARRHIEPHKAVFILVGCKRDMAMSEENAREVSEDEARAFAHVNHLPYVETSSKTGLNVEDAFAILTQAIYDKIESGEYKIDGSWDGIKRGFYGGLGTSQINNNYPGQGRSRRHGTSIVNLVEAQAERKLCC